MANVRRPHPTSSAFGGGEGRMGAATSRAILWSQAYARQVPMGHTLILISAAIAASLLAATPAASQQEREVPSEWRLCINEGNLYPPDIAADGCTAVIRSGNREPRELAVAFAHRGSAYRARGDLDGALSDYDS